MKWNCERACFGGGVQCPQSAAYEVWTRHPTLTNTITDFLLCGEHTAELRATRPVQAVTTWNGKLLRHSYHPEPAPAVSGQPEADR